VSLAIAAGTIDTHTHLVPRVLPRSATALARPWVKCIDDRSAQLVADERVVRELDHRCWDMAARLEVMDAESVAAQVVSPMPELLTPWLSAGDTLEIAAHVNEAIAELVSRRPDRFIGLGMVGLQDAEAAARQLESIRAQGLSGVEVPADISGALLSEKRFEVFLSEIERHSLTIFVHPIRPPDPGIATLPAADVLVGYPMQTGRAVVDLASAGITESFPRLKLLFAHGGGVAAPLLNRCSHGWHAVPGIQAASARDPLDVARAFYFDTLVYDAAAVRYLAATFGADRLMVGSDFPFVMREKFPGRLLAQTGLGEEALRSMRRDNALALFKANDDQCRPSPPIP
jgi:aminocarboxymuconate-semialdehyde decarboxylase